MSKSGVTQQPNLQDYTCKNEQYTLRKKGVDSSVLHYTLKEKGKERLHRRSLCLRRLSPHQY
eukprot:1140350-Pelagomonas_calceolata.AAC.2